MAEAELQLEYEQLMYTRVQMNAINILYSDKLDNEVGRCSKGCSSKMEAAGCGQQRTVL